MLVTGGSGFIGTNLVEHFREAGWEVRSFDIAPPRKAEHQSLWTPMDILDRQRLVAETREFGPSVVLHFAARTDLRERRNLGGYASNIDGVCNLIDAVQLTKSVELVIVASSQLVCPLGYIPRDDYDYRPTTLYGQSKVLSERIVRVAALNAAWTIVRPTSVWGPWFDAPFRDLFRRIARGSYFHPAGHAVWKQWSFVGNTVFQIGKVVDAPRTKIDRKTFYLAEYEAVELYAFVDKVREALGARPIRKIPARALLAAALAGDIARKLGWQDPPLSSSRYRNIVQDETQDTEPIRDIAGPLPFSVGDGITLTVDWLGADPTRP
jgi:nucleoside-diphosphate-sugar epimerase